MSKKYNIIDLKRLYDKYNELLFNNELPNNFKFKWTNTRKSVGLVRSVGLRKETKDGYIMKNENISSFEISKEFNLSGDKIDGIIIHEMIHVWQIVKKLPYIGGDHGKYFMEKRDEIISKGYDIPLTGECIDFVGDLMKKSKDFLYIVLNDDSTFTMPLIKGVDIKDMYTMLYQFNHHFNRNIDRIEIRSTFSKSIKSYTFPRSIKNSKMYYGLTQLTYNNSNVLATLDLDSMYEYWDLMNKK